MGKPRPDDPSPSHESHMKKKSKQKRENVEAPMTNKGRDLHELGGEGEGGTKDRDLDELGGEGEGGTKVVKIPEDEKYFKEVKKKKNKKRESLEAIEILEDEKYGKKKKKKRESLEATGTNKGRDLDESAGVEGEAGATEIPEDEKYGKKKKKKKKKNGHHIDSAVATRSGELKKKKSDATDSDQANITTDGTSCQEGQTEVHSEEDFAMLYREGIKFKSRGIMNLGRTCYVNVILQCLLHIRPLLAYVLSGTHGDECRSTVARDWCLLCALRRHISSLSEGSSPTCPVEIVEHVSTIAGRKFELSTDQDAPEFMSHAIRKLQYDVLYKHNSKKVEAADTIINHIFCGELFSDVMCEVCEHTSRSCEPLQELCIQVGDSPQSLQECLSQFFRVEEIPDYSCPSCNENVMAGRHYVLNKSPNLLTIILKSRLSTGRKPHVSYPMELDMTQYKHSKDGDNMYDLCAVVIYVNVGTFKHYYCYVKDYEGNWSQFNDIQCTPVSVEDVLDKPALMLLYMRRTVLPKPLPLEVSMEKKREQVKIDPFSHPWPDEEKKKESMESPKCVSQESMEFPKCLSPQMHTYLFSWKKRKLDTLALGEDKKKKLRDTYWIAEDTEKEVVIKRIDEELDHYHTTGHFRLPSRGKDSSVYNTDVGSLLMVDKGVYQSRSELKEKRLADSLKVTKQHLEDDMFIAERAFYYKDTDLYGDSTNSASIIAAVCSMLRVTRTSLHVTVSSTGSIAGPIKLYIKEDIIVDCWRSGMGGCKIPDESYYINKIETLQKVRFILVVEKETIFRLLTSLRLHKKYNCIIITGSGQPDTATRFVVWLLRTTLKIPVYGFVDANASGIRILCTYRFGSQGKSHDNVILAVPDLKWAGLDSFDVRPIPKPLTTKNVAKSAVMNARQIVRDTKKALQASKKAANNVTMLTNLLKLKHIQDDPDWVSRINAMLLSGKTGDIDKCLGYKEILPHLEKKIPEMKESEKDAGKAKRQRQLFNIGEMIKDSSCKDEVSFKEEDLPFLAKKTNNKVAKELKFEKVMSDDDTKKESSNTRKRKGDTISQDPASPTQNFELKKKSKKKESSLLEIEDRKGLVIEEMSKVASNGSKTLARPNEPAPCDESYRKKKNKRKGRDLDEPLGVEGEAGAKKILEDEKYGKKKKKKKRESLEATGTNKARDLDEPAGVEGEAGATEIPEDEKYGKKKNKKKKKNGHHIDSAAATRSGEPKKKKKKSDAIDLANIKTDGTSYEESQTEKDTSGLAAENRELKLQLQSMKKQAKSMKKQAKLKNDLNDALREEVRRLKIAQGKLQT